VAVVPDFPKKTEKKKPKKPKKQKKKKKKTEYSPPTSTATIFARAHALDILQPRGPRRVADFGIENQAGTPVYVHAKIRRQRRECATVGSDNLKTKNHAVVDARFGTHMCGSTTKTVIPKLRLRLRLIARPRTPRSTYGDDADLRDPVVMFDEFVQQRPRLGGVATPLANAARAP
jgi:hypothetical protein